MREKVDTCSPIGVLEDFFRSSDSETSEPNMKLEIPQKSKPNSRWHGLVQLLRTKSKRSLAPMHPLLKLSKKMSNSMREIITPKLESDSDSMYPFKSPWKNFSLHELQAATKNFSHGL